MNPRKYLIWVNLYMGIYNIYLYVQGEWLFNLFIGCMIVAVWVWCRDELFNGE